MKVRFTGIEGHPPSVSQGADALRPGSVYVVLEIYCQVDGPNYFRVEFHKDELPPLFDSRIFEVVDRGPPPSWTISTEWDGSLTIGPSAWQAHGFWEKFMEHTPSAVEIYERERDLLMFGS